jgi:catechol 2,3-dioxygenase-like lactoylglutathione lyase family enzyme
VIKKIGHVSIAVTDVDAALKSATTLMGLRVSEEADGVTYLTHGAPHHSLEYVAGAVDGLHHVGLVAADEGALPEIRQRAEAGGFRIVRDEPFDATADAGFVLEGPEGFLFEIYVGMPEDEPPYAPTGVKPRRFGHVTFTSSDSEAMRSFLETVLDFRVSDDVGGGYFMRCNVDHHGIAFLPGAGRFHHHAWEVQSTVELGLLSDRVDETGGSVLWGPLRHGAGSNIAVYFQEPSGALVEYYCDLDRVYDEEGYTPVVWDDADHKWWSRWAPLMPEGFVDLGLPQVDV